MPQTFSIRSHMSMKHCAARKWLHLGKQYALVSTALRLVLFSWRTVEKVLRTVLHQYRRLILCLVAAASRSLTPVRIEPLNVFDLAKQTTSLVRFRLE